MKETFRSVLSSEKLLLVDFSAEWCGPCKMQSPILKQVKDTVGEKVRIIKIDVDKNQAVASEYQVQGVPTLILFKNGQPVWRQSGVASKDQITSVIHQHG